MIDSSLEERVTQLEQAIDLVQLRNRKVDLEKAWEISNTRRLAILILTYIVASLVLYLIGVNEFWLSAIIPTVGYLLSTFSVTLLKKRWMRARKG